MQNSTFGWASSLSSSLAAQKVWTGVGYQSSLTDLFLKSPQFNTGISQLAAASSYLEKMSNFSNGNTENNSDQQSNDSPLHQHQNHHHHSTAQQHQQLNQLKCPHPEAKNKPGQPCEVCQDYSLCLNSSPSGHQVTSKSNNSHSEPSLRLNQPSATSEANSQPNMEKSLHGQSSSALHHHHHHLQSPTGLGTSASNIQHLQNNNNSLGSGINLLQGPSTLTRRNSTSSSNRNNNNSTSRSGSTNNNSSSKTFLCPVCHRNFTQKGNLKTHMMIHSGDKPYACQVCGKSFTQKGNVDTHMKIHTGEKDQNCSLCGKRFTQRGNLRTHMRSVHTKEKPHACGICGKSFSQKGNMMTHLRTHNKEDRFPCTLCGKTFSQKGNLKTHMQRHSGTLPARRYGPRAKKNQQSSTAASSHFPMASTSREVGRSHLKSTDDDSASPLDHSLQEASGQLAKHHQQVLDANQHLLNQHRSASSSAVAAQMGMSFGPRFYPPSSTISAPLAHTASWLAATKGRMAAPSYDTYGLSFTGFQHPSNLGRLSLLNAQPHHLDHVNQEEIVISHHKSSRAASATSSTVASGSGSSTSNTNPSSHASHEYNSQNQPNPDFSQLLD